MGGTRTAVGRHAYRYSACLRQPRTRCVPLEGSRWPTGEKRALASSSSISRGKFVTHSLCSIRCRNPSANLTTNGLPFCPRTHVSLRALIADRAESSLE